MSPKRFEVPSNCFARSNRKDSLEEREIESNRFESYLFCRVNETNS